MQRELSFSSLDGEAPDNPYTGCLSVLLSPPITALLLGVLLFFALSHIPLSWPQEKEAVVNTRKRSLASFFAPQVLRWESQIQEWAKEYDLDPNLVATVMQIESCGDPRALSSAGAIGLFQVMPYHFAAGEDSFSPPTNARRGLAYLAKSLNNFSGDAQLALAGYNGGIQGASRPQSAWPDETVTYIYWGSNIYADTLSGKAQSSVLDEWLTSGGTSLCAQAEQRLALLPES